MLLLSLALFAGIGSVAVGYVLAAKFGIGLARARVARECAALEAKLAEGWEKLDTLPERVKHLEDVLCSLLDATCQQPPARERRRGSHA